MKEVRWGIIAAGGIANAFAHSIQYSKNSKLCCVLGRTEEKVNSFAEKHNCLPYFDLETFLSSDIDAVYIATPHDSHFFYSMEAIKRKLHVLCEKPLSVNSTEAMILTNEAKKNDIFLMEAFMYRTHPQTLETLKLCKEYFKDTDVRIFSSFGFDAPVDKSHRLRNLNLAGGAILDVGCYPLSMARLIAGSLNDEQYLDPISIEVKGSLDATGVDNKSSANFIFSKNISAYIETAINEELKNNLIIKSDKVEIIVPEPWHCGQFQDGNYSIELNFEGKKTIISNKDEVGLFTREINEASKCILQGDYESSSMSHKDTLGNMLWLEKWYLETGVKYPQNIVENSPIFSSQYEPVAKLVKSEIEGISKKGSRLVFGCDNQTSQLHASTMFDNFFNNGGNIFDTAYIYNDGKSDKYLGEWINTNGISKEILVLGKGAHTPHCEPQFIKQQLEESLDRLKLESLDIYCLHRDNLDVPVEEFIDALNEILAEGLISVAGASNWTLERFSNANNYADRNKKIGFKVLSNNFSLANMNEPVWPGCINCNEQYLNYLFENDIYLFPWSSQARGFFLEKDLYPKAAHVANPSLDEEKRVWHDEINLLRRERCFQLSKKLGCLPIELALAYVINKNPNIFPLVGPRSVYESESCMKASLITLDDQQMNWLTS
jgi:aryl-alcohol dehydrogenase-like predicted oxidoreductase/predicted dehydrogenase